ncbi:MAG: acyltransferase family protein [Thiopseudomonas sp.]|nr:acyltransferase family protein [Thiopseudomonas sp.]MCK9464762.1 acyltransferase family protein [Thiopseudomonas sp.]
MKYRAEIDGLRTIAIISVLIYHAEFLLSGRNILPGGFFSVDVFFVISGYLVPTIILNELPGFNSQVQLINFRKRN